MMFMMFVMSELKFRAQNLSRPMRNKISHHRVVYDEKNSTGKTPIEIPKKYCGFIVLLTRDFLTW